MKSERIDLSRKMRMGFKVFKANLFKKYTPLTVGFSLTRRCNLNCHYCTFPDDLRDELSTRQVFSIVDELKQLGTEQISYTGGEPLLRRDFGDVIDYTKRKNILMTVSTNGLLIKNCIADLKKVSMIMISLDGSEEINVQSRATPGAYSKIMEAIELCKTNGIRVMISIVISKCNVGQIDTMLDLMKKLNLRGIFQPAMAYRLGKKDPNPIAPDPTEYKRAMNQLIERKMAGEKTIFNSLTTLRHLYNWPTPTAIKCSASKLHCRIDCNGDIYPCGRMENRVINCVKLGVAAAFRQSGPDPCKDCWCANMVEFNLVAALNMDTVMNMLSKNSS